MEQQQDHDRGHDEPCRVGAARDDVADRPVGLGGYVEVQHLATEDHLPDQQGDVHAKCDGVGRTEPPADPAASRQQRKQPSQRQRVHAYGDRELERLEPDRRVDHRAVVDDETDERGGAQQYHRSGQHQQRAVQRKKSFLAGHGIDPARRRPRKHWSHPPAPW